MRRIYTKLNFNIYHTLIQNSTRNLQKKTETKKKKSDGIVNARTKQKKRKKKAEIVRAA